MTCEVDVTEKAPLRQIYLWEGNKILKLSVDLVHHKASTRIDILEGGTRKKGATTILYQRARQIMEEIATQTGKPLTYEFTTENSKMIGWATAAGASIFNWDVVQDLGTDLVFIAEAVINPSL